jgi:hypothetical protein
VPQDWALAAPRKMELLVSISAPPAANPAAARWTAAFMSMKN